MIQPIEGLLKELRSKITINAPAERVWDELTGLESFEEWNPFMRRSSGIVEVGAVPAGDTRRLVGPRIPIPLPGKQTIVATLMIISSGG